MAGLSLGSPRTGRPGAEGGSEGRRVQLEMAEPPPQVGNLGLLFMLLFFIYAALGVELFGRLGESCGHPMGVSVPSSVAGP